MKMQFNTPAPRQNKFEIELKDFKGGVNRLLEESRISFNEAKEATNLIQVQDGLWKPRWGTAYYGADLGASIDGATEFVKSDGTTEIVAIAGGKAYKSTDGGAWSEISGATFTAGNTCYFLQISGYLYIANGVDSLARYNGTLLTTYTQINAPTGLAGSRTGLASGAFTYYAQVTAINEIGETTGSTEATLTLNKPRDQWAASDSVTWTWNAVSGASAYQVYLSETSGYETFLASSTTTTLIDDGTVVINPYVEVPDSNTTGAPKFRSMAVSGNRIWATNDVDNPFTVYFSGTGQYMGVFSDFYGGGWINLEKGGRERPRKVLHYQSGAGEGIATVLCSTPEGRGAVWQIGISSATVGDTSFSVPSATKVIGSYGTDSQLGVAQDANNVWFINRRGIFTIGPEKQYYGILRTNEKSSRIRNYMRGIVGAQIDKSCAYHYDSKIFFSIPTSTAGNNRTIIYDLERTNWIVDWSFGAKQFFEYTDNSSTKTTHFLYVPVNGTRLIEIGENIQGDLGVAFATSYVSGRYQLSKLWKDFVRLKRVYIKRGNPRGAMTFEIAGSGKNEPFSLLGSVTISDVVSMTGMGFDIMGDIEMGDTDGTPTTFSDSADPRYIDIKKKIRDVQFRITTNSIDSDYTLLSFILEGRAIKTSPPSSWKLN